MAAGKSVLLVAALAHAVAASAAGVAAKPTAAAPGLMAGAARVDITPSKADLPKPFTTIHDHLFVRAVVLDDGASRAAIVVADLPTIAPDVFEDLRRRIAAEARVPLSNVLLAVTHTHNAVRLDRNPIGIIIPGSAKITDDTSRIIIDAVRQAAGHLEPARAGYAEGTTNMIGGGDRAPAGRPSPVPIASVTPDKTLGVLRIETTDGEPIALLVNSALEPIMQMPAKTEVSADLAGATQRYVEQRYGDRAVVLYTVGSQSSGAYSARARQGVPAGDPGPLTEAVGTILGEDVLALAAKTRTSAAIRVAGAMRTIRCPGKETTPYNLPDRCSDAPDAALPRCDFRDRDIDPVALQVGVLRIGDTTLVQADANITQPVWQRVKGGTPQGTILVNLMFGPMHYVVQDSDYPANTYQVTASTAKQGCAAQGFADAVTGLFAELSSGPG
ncbi:hypothetical protein WBP07_25510 [Novosphingobium sp. BL-8A]|uniref:hypothetical protein n=1 Tax=Novosphingobium sp. BL-8A TaxID=3127639 RepID=UPI00375681C7